MKQYDHEIDFKHIIITMWAKKFWILCLWVLISASITGYLANHYVANYRTTLYLSVPKSLSLSQLYTHHQILQAHFEDKQVRSAVFGTLWDADKQTWRIMPKTTLRPKGMPTVGEFLQFIDQNVQWYRDNETIKVVLSWHTLAQKQALLDWLKGALQAEKNKRIAQLSFDLRQATTSADKSKLEADIKLIQHEWPTTFNVGIEHQANANLIHLVTYLWLGVLCALLALHACWLILRETL